MAQIGPEAMSIELVVRILLRVQITVGPKYTCDETWEEWLGAEVGVVVLEMLLGGGHELDSNELEATIWSMTSRI
jgi:hypothetical protein